MTAMEVELMDIKARLARLETMVTRLTASNVAMIREAAAEWEALSPDERPLVSVPAMYDGEHIALLEAPPSREPYRVLVTFVEPVSDVGAPLTDLTRFWASFGAWHDDRPAGEILADIHDARRSRPEPPAL